MLKACLVISRLFVGKWVRSFDAFWVENVLMRPTPLRLLHRVSNRRQIGLCRLVVYGLFFFRGMVVNFV